MIYGSSAFFFYSGTGSSLRVAMWMADVMHQTGVPATVSPSRGAAPGWAAAERPAGSGTSLVGLVLPTHGFTAPGGALRLAHSLPRAAAWGGHCDAVVVATRGATRVGGIVIPGYEGSAALLCALILQLKGYRILAAVGVDMPSNWTALHPAMPPDAVAEIRSRGRKQISALMATVLSGARVALPVLTALVALALLPVSIGYMLVGRRLLGKLFFSSERCTGCGLCAARCPHSAIEMRGSDGARYPIWTLRCESCMRCMAFCPEQSVEVSHVYAIGTGIIAMALTRARWLTEGEPSVAPFDAVPGWVVDLVVWSVLMLLGYPLRDLLLRASWFRCLAGLVTVTRWYRRYHEPETQITDLPGSDVQEHS